MALIGESERTGHLRRRLAPRQQLPRLGQTQLDQISMRRQPKGCLEGPRQAKAINPTGLSQIIQPNVLVDMGMQIVTRDEGLSVFGAATLQLLNPKVWMMAVAVTSVFAGGGDKTMRLLVLSLVFLSVSLPCMTLWALLGVGSARFFGSPQAFKRVNYALAFLLLVSAWLTVLV